MLRRIATFSVECYARRCHHWGREIVSRIGRGTSRAQVSRSSGYNNPVTVILLPSGSVGGLRKRSWYGVSMPVHIAGVNEYNNLDAPGPITGSGQSSRWLALVEEVRPRAEVTHRPRWRGHREGTRRCRGHRTPRLVSHRHSLDTRVLWRPRARGKHSRGDRRQRGRRLDPGHPLRRRRVRRLRPISSRPRRRRRPVAPVAAVSIP